MGAGTYTACERREIEGAKIVAWVLCRCTMDVQPISYRGRIVAACTRRRFLLADDLEGRPPGDPELVFVVMMCAYASDIARGLLPGPYDAPTRVATRAPCWFPGSCLSGRRSMSIVRPPRSACRSTSGARRATSTPRQRERHGRV